MNRSEESETEKNWLPANDICFRLVESINVALVSWSNQFLLLVRPVVVAGQYQQYWSSDFFSYRLKSPDTCVSFTIIVSSIRYEIVYIALDFHIILKLLFPLKQNNGKCFTLNLESKDEGKWPTSAARDIPQYIIYLTKWRKKIAKATEEVCSNHASLFLKRTPFICYYIITYIKRMLLMVRKTNCCRWRKSHTSWPLSTTKTAMLFVHIFFVVAQLLCSVYSSFL